MTLSEVKDCCGNDHPEIYCGTLYLVDLLPKIRIEVVGENRLAARVATEARVPRWL